MATTLDPSILAAIQSAANSFAQQAGSYDWTSLLGSFFDPSKPLPFGTGTLKAEEDAGYFTNPPFAGNPTLAAALATGRVYSPPTNNPDLGRVLPVQNLGQETLGGRAQDLAEAEASGTMLSPTTMFTVPGSGNWGNGTVDQISLAQMKQGLADWVPYATLDKLSDKDIAEAWAEATGHQMPVQVANSGQATLAAQGLYGNSNGAAGGGTATQGAISQAGNFIQNAAAGSFANPWTYQAKLQGLQQAGALGAILGNNIQNSSGTSLATLQNTPNLTNVQLGTDLANAQLGKPMSSLSTNFLSQMLGVPQTGNGAATTSAAVPGEMYAGGAPNSAALNPADGGTTVYGGTHYHVNSNPLLAENPGAATPLQEFNKLDPSSQDAYIDLQSLMPNGQTRTDFLSQMKNAAPSASFRPAAYASSGI